MDLEFELWHFEGTREAQHAALERHGELANVPAWARPAVDGLEYRLEVWSRTS